MSSVERSTFLVVLYKKLLPRDELEAIADEARAAGVPLLRALERRLGPEELDRVERTLARHARRCERCAELTYLLPGKSEADTPCERCGGALLVGPAGGAESPAAAPGPVTLMQRAAADAGDDAPDEASITKWTASPVEQDAPGSEVTRWVSDATQAELDRTKWPEGKPLPEPTPPSPDSTRWDSVAKPPPPPAAGGPGLVDQLERLVKLRDAGVLSAEEFERAKQRLIG